MKSFFLRRVSFIPICFLCQHVHSSQFHKLFYTSKFSIPPEIVSILITLTNTFSRRSPSLASPPSTPPPLGEPLTNAVISIQEDDFHKKNCTCLSGIVTYIHSFSAANELGYFIMKQDGLKKVMQGITLRGFLFY